MKDSSISIILPAYNEKENVIPLSEKIHKFLIDYKHEIIVVDDNSPDGTYQALIDLNQTWLKPVLRTEDRGFAKSIRCGIENAKGDIIVVMDSDFNHCPEYLPIMIDNLKYYNCVIASRFLYFPIEKHLSIFRIVSSWFFNLFIRIVLFSKITENLFGFFAIKRNVLYTLDFDKIFWGFGDYYIRFVFFLQKKNCTILQIPAVFGERLHGKGNKGLLKRIVRYLKETFILRFKNI
ncbi:MAG: glycosyltransferase [Bacteroidales bacterium]|nr:glycosyltransferase [Bacteroidales bacterium]